MDLAEEFRNGKEFRELKRKMDEFHNRPLSVDEWIMTETEGMLRPRLDRKDEEDNPVEIFRDWNKTDKDTILLLMPQLFASRF